MKKLLPLVAILATVAFSAPVMAEPTADAKKEMHNEHKVMKHHGKKGMKHHSGMKHHKGMKHHERAMHEEGMNNNRQGMMMQQQQQPRRAAAPAKMWMPSMQQGFQH